MSGIEVAGLVISALPIIIEALKVYNDVSPKVAEFKQAAREFEELRKLVDELSPVSNLAQSAEPSVTQQWSLPLVVMYAIFAILVIGSVVTAGMAIWKARKKEAPDKEASRHDANFFASISQGLMSILGSFCMLNPFRDRKAEEAPPARHPLVLRFLLSVSIIATISGMILQPYEDAASIGLGYVGNAAQIAATFMLIAGGTDKLNDYKQEYKLLYHRYLSKWRKESDLRRPKGSLKGANGAYLPSFGVIRNKSFHIEGIDVTRPQPVHLRRSLYEMQVEA